MPSAPTLLFPHISLFLYLFLSPQARSSSDERPLPFADTYCITGIKRCQNQDVVSLASRQRETRPDSNAWAHGPSGFPMVFRLIPTVFMVVLYGFEISVPRASRPYPSCPMNHNFFFVTHNCKICSSSAFFGSISDDSWGDNPGFMLWMKNDSQRYIICLCLMSCIKSHIFWDKFWKLLIKVASFYVQGQLGLKIRIWDHSWYRLMLKI